MAQWTGYTKLIGRTQSERTLAVKASVSLHEALCTLKSSSHLYITVVLQRNQPMYEIRTHARGHLLNCCKPAFGVNKKAL